MGTVVATTRSTTTQMVALRSFVSSASVKAASIFRFSQQLERTRVGLIREHCDEAIADIP